MQLAEAGSIELDAPVQPYLPWFQLADADASVRLTVRNLLHHTSGLTFASGREYLVDTDDSRGALERHVRRLSMTKLARPVGRQFEYSNSNYDVLGLIVQTVSNQPFEEYIRSHVFAPLAMQHSFLSESGAAADGLVISDS
jgi:CubicO group peptidase (beta-lactamase class C family)